MLGKAPRKDQNPVGIKDNGFYTHSDILIPIYSFGRFNLPRFFSRHRLLDGMANMDNRHRRRIVRVLAQDKQHPIRRAGRRSAVQHPPDAFPEQLVFLGHRPDCWKLRQLGDFRIKPFLPGTGNLNAFPRREVIQRGGAVRFRSQRKPKRLNKRLI